MENKALCLAYSVGDQVFPQFPLNIDRIGLSIESSQCAVFFLSTFNLYIKERTFLIVIIFAQIFQLSNKENCGR